METSKLSIPTVHMNGTSRDALLQQYMNAYNALDNALDAMRQANPHGRDYYPQGDKAFLTASAQHLARIAMLATIRDEMENIALAIHAND